MGYHANSIPILSAATQSQAGNTAGIAVGEYVAGSLFIYVTSLAAASRVTPRFEVSPNGSIGTAGQYALFKVFATSLRATGMSVLTLPVLGSKWGRVAWNLAGTSPAIKFAAWFVGQGMY